MPITYEGYDPKIRRYIASRVRKFSKSPGFWAGFGAASILWLIAIPILAEPVSKWLKKKV